VNPGARNNVAIKWAAAYGHEDVFFSSNFIKTFKIVDGQFSF